MTPEWSSEPDAFAEAELPRRALRRDQPGREGMEAELVARLARDVTPASARRALVRGLDGELSARATLAQLLLVCGSVTAVRELVDQVTARTDEDSRAGDSLVRDRADALTRLFVEHEAACGRGLARALAAHDAPEGPHAPDAPAVDEETYLGRVFERIVAGS